MKINFKVIWGWLWCYQRGRTSMSKNTWSIQIPTVDYTALSIRWVAVNTVDFFNQINMLYGTITEFCTEQSCTVMSAGPKYEVRIFTTTWPLFNREIWSTATNNFADSNPFAQVPLGGREPSEETNQMLGAEVHWLPYDMGPGELSRINDEDAGTIVLWNTILEI